MRNSYKFCKISPLGPFTGLAAENVSVNFLIFSSLKHGARRGLQIFPHRRNSCRRLYTYRFWKMKLRENSAKIFKNTPFFKKKSQFFMGKVMRSCTSWHAQDPKRLRGGKWDSGNVFFSFPRVRIHTREHFSLP